MSRPGSAEAPLRIAVIGSGPAGFYAVQHLFQQSELHIEVDMFDRLPTPYGLVRHGVAPDHQKIKNVIAVYHKLAQRPGFAFFGNVEFGRDLDLDALGCFYHQAIFCTGAQTDRRLGVPGEDLDGSHPATDFVAWYNGHPDYVDLRFDLSRETAVVVGVGNVAVDVARVLCRDPAELASTDIADHALDALRESRVRTVWLLGRRGPAQAAFTNPEVKELGELKGCATRAYAGEVELDPLTRAALDAAPDKATTRKLQILAGFAEEPAADVARRLFLRFLVSPTEILGDDRGRVRAVRLVHNRLVADGDRLAAVPTDRGEEIEAGLVFRSVGYHGVALPGLPFDERRGVVPNTQGRIGTTGGLYVSGWIKRGPSGVIGTNKADSVESVETMLADLREGRLLSARPAGRDAVESFLRKRGVTWISYPDWCRIDALETSRGRAAGRPRVKLIRREEFLRVLDEDR